MNFDESLRSTGAILTDRPADVLPIYLLGTAISVFTQSILFVGFGLAFLSLRGTGRLPEVAAAASRLDVNPDAPTPDGMVDQANVERLAEAIVGLFTPTVLAILALTLVAALVVYLLVRSFTTAASIHTAAATLRGSVGTVEGVTGASRDWKRFLALQIARIVILWAPTVVLGALALATGSVVVAVFGFLLWVPATLVAALLFLFVPQTIVIDGVGVVEGIKRNLGYMRRNVLTTVAFVVFLLGSAVGVGILAVALQFLGVSSLLSVVVWFLVTPFTGLLKTGLYLDEPPVKRVGVGSYGSAFVGAFRRGLHAMRAFVVGRFGYVAAMLGVFAVSIVGGWLSTRSYAFDRGLLSEALAGVDPTTIFGTFPVDTFVTLMANNWMVSIGTAFAGLGFGVPAVVNMMFNGFIVGALGGIFNDPVLFAAFIVPHGIVEIPSLAISGAFGLHLGRIAWGYARGSRTAEELAAEIRGTYYALLGLLPLFVIAAFIEAFVTPYVAAYVI